MNLIEQRGHALHLLAAAGVLRVKEHRGHLAVARPEGLLPAQILFVPKTARWRDIVGKVDGEGVLTMLRHLRVPMVQCYAALAMQAVPEAPPLEIYTNEEEGRDTGSTLP